MNKELKEKWIKALRSGKFKQGRSFLNANDKYCCLGVLCEIHPEIEKNRDDAINNGYLFYYGNKQMRSVLNSAFRKEVGIDDNQQSTLISMNDSGYTFNQIADWIEDKI